MISRIIDGCSSEACATHDAMHDQRRRTKPAPLLQMPGMRALCRDAAGPPSEGFCVAVRIGLRVIRPSPGPVITNGRHAPFPTLPVFGLDQVFALTPSWCAWQ